MSLIKIKRQKIAHRLRSNCSKYKVFKHEILEKKEENISNGPTKSTEDEVYILMRLYIMGKTLKNTNLHVLDIHEFQKKRHFHNYVFCKQCKEN